jgi:hypothetical protein
MNESIALPQCDDTAFNKQVWPAVIGVLSCVLAIQAITGYLGQGLIAYGSRSSPYPSSIMWAIRPWYFYIAFWTYHLSSVILLVAGIVLLKEWHRSGKGQRYGKLIHLVFAWTWIAGFLAFIIPEYYYTWQFLLQSTGLDGVPNSIEDRQLAAWILSASCLGDLLRIAYPVFLLKWFWKR